MGTLYYSNQELLEGKNKKKRNVFRGRISYKDAEGKRHYKVKTLQATCKRDALKELTAWRADMEREHAESVRGGNASVKADMSISKFAKRHIEIKEKTKAIERSTVSGYMTSLKYIERGFGDMPVKDICTDDIESWIADLYAKPYSNSTVRKAYHLLKATLDDAVDAGVFNRNPAAKVKTPPLTNKEPGNNALDTNTIKEILAKLNKFELTPVTVAAYLAMLAGLRRGEICGLQWRDLDMDNSVIWVKRAIGVGEGGAFEKSTKTGQIRTTILINTLCDVLMRWKQIQREKFASATVALQPDSYVIGDPLKFYDPTRLSKEWTALAKLLNIRGTENRIVKMHELRHTFATVANAIGLDVKVIASCLGHTNAAMTLNVYASVDPNAKRQAAAKYENAIGRKCPAEYDDEERDNEQ